MLITHHAGGEPLARVLEWAPWGLADMALREADSNLRVPERWVA